MALVGDRMRPTRSNWGLTDLGRRLSRSPRGPLLASASSEAKPNGEANQRAGRHFHLHFCAENEDENRGGGVHSKLRRAFARWLPQIRGLERSWASGRAGCALHKTTCRRLLATARRLHKADNNGRRPISWPMARFRPAAFRASRTDSQRLGSEREPSAGCLS